MSDQPVENTSNDGQTAAMCCANFYEQDIVQQLMGENFHPGGAALSGRLVQALCVGPGANTADIACGLGSTVRHMAQLGFHATGLDFSEVNISRAQAAAAGAAAPKAQPVLPVVSLGETSQPCCEPGDPCCSEPEPAVATVPGGSTKYLQGSADQLPFDDESLDAVTCECAVSTFADQAAVAREAFRVLKPGGVFGMTDMIVDGYLPENVAASIAPWTCLAKAHTVPGYQRLFLDAGFSVANYVDESDTLTELVSDLKRKLVMAGMGKALGAIPDLQLDIREIRGLMKQAVDLVADGTVQYGMIVFSKGKRTKTACDSGSASSCC